MSSGDGGNPFQSLAPQTGGNFFEDLAVNLVNYGLQTTTAGVVGANKDGIGTGASVGVVKEVTGAAAAEEANKLAREQFEQAKVEAEAARLEAVKQRGINQITQSQKAGAARAASMRNSSSPGASSSYSLGDDERDFLGL